jgi:hypothetical protein
MGTGRIQSRALRLLAICGTIALSALLVPAHSLERESGYCNSNSITIMCFSVQQDEQGWRPPEVNTNRECVENESDPTAFCTNCMISIEDECNLTGYDYVTQDPENFSEPGWKDAFMR